MAECDGLCVCANTERLTFDISTAAVRCLPYHGGVYILREFYSQYFPCSYKHAAHLKLFRHTKLGEKKGAVFFRTVVLNVFADPWIRYCNCWPCSSRTVN